MEAFALHQTRLSGEGHGSEKEPPCIRLIFTSVVNHHHFNTLVPRSRPAFRRLQYGKQVFDFSFMWGEPGKEVIILTDGDFDI